MTRFLFMAFSAIVYLIFFATFLYLIGFVAGLWFLPSHVDRGPAVSLMAALPIDIALIAIFGLQHSVMARPGFKAMWTRIVPQPIERSIYVLAASLALILLFVVWQPIHGTLWQIEAPLGRKLVWGVFGLGWLVVLLSTFMISHFELFGLKQVWGHARNAAPAKPEFRTPLFYRLVRHPLYSGFILAFWAIPVMTVGHLLLAVSMLVYILIAIGHEERDLINLFGERYVDYRRRVGMLTPKLRR